MKRIADKRGKERLPGPDVGFVKLRLTKTWSAYIRSDLRRTESWEGAKPKLPARDRAAGVDGR
jgi:hypothetical protein